MKTLDIVLIGSGVALLGYLAYKNKDQFNKPLTDSDNQPLRADFDTGTNNGNGYQTEEEKPASDPVKLLNTPLLPINEVSVTNAVVKTDDSFHTGEPVAEPVAEPVIIPFQEKESFLQTFFNKALEPVVEPITEPAPVLIPFQEKQSFLESLLNPIPKYNTTTPYTEEVPVLKPLVADVSPSAPVVSIADTPEQYPTLLYNNTEKHIEPGTYDYGLPDRDTYKAETVMYAQDF